MFIKIINNTPADYPYNPQTDHPLTSFPVGASYPSFNCYWVHPTTPNNPNTKLYNPVESTPVFNSDRWEQSWEFVEKPPVPVVPNWDGLYAALMSSDSYMFALTTSLSTPNLSSALSVVIDSIQYGIMRPDSLAAFPAFQSAINVLMMTLANIQQSFTPEQLAEVRTLLDANGFNSITLQ